jgi:hypothetical protein
MNEVADSTEIQFSVYQAIALFFTPKAAIRGYP